MARNDLRITEIATYLAQNASEASGVTVQILANKTGYSRQAIARYIREHPALRESKSPVWPKGYWFDVNTVISPKTVALKETAINRPLTDQPVEARPFNPEIHTISLRTLGNYLADESDTSIAKALREVGGRIVTNCEAVKDWRADPANNPLPDYLPVDGALTRYALETFIQLLERVENDPRLDSIEWWEVFNE